MTHIYSLSLVTTPNETDIEICETEKKQVIGSVHAYWVHSDIEATYIALLKGY